MLELREVSLAREERLDAEERARASFFVFRDFCFC